MTSYNFETRAQAWLSNPFDSDTQYAVQELIDKNPKELEDAFSRDLTFGTGGIRGIMGVGTNRINKYTIGRSTQGLCDYINRINRKSKVVIAYDCRHNSRKFAEIAAHILSANGIEAYLFSDLRPTPELSFAIRHLECQAGIVVTASHNPPKYNGYKVYWSDSGQIVPPQDGEIIKQINNTSFEDIEFSPNESLIHIIDEEVDKAFADASTAHGSFKGIDRSGVIVVFTPLHGTSVTSIPRVFEQAGYTNFHVVEEQATPDGNFPTVKSPNPEEKASLEIAIKKAENLNADIVIGTDPDCDRYGLVVRDLDGNLVCLNGNQSMVVLTDFLLRKCKEKASHKRAFIASTVVSTPMIAVIAKENNVDCKLTLTGFKWIAKTIRDFPELEFIGGGEESYGYLIGDFVRDKDAVTSALACAEIATETKSKGSSFYKALLKCYIKYGFYKEHLISLTKEDIDGPDQINHIMQSFRAQGLSTIDNSKLCCVDDYLSQVSKNVISDTSTKIELPKTDLIIFKSEDGSQVAVRPSGTEPKIKFYISVNTALESIEKYKEIEKLLDGKIQRIIKQLGL